MKRIVLEQKETISIMNTTENNKKLAEFMGAEIDGLNYRLVAYDNIKVCMHPNHLKYHTDWNWLMQVVDKIESLGFESKINNDTIFNSCVFLNKPNIKVPINIGYISECTKIEAVYNACVEFVEWWNKNK